MTVDLSHVPTGIPVDGNGKGVQTSYNNMASGNSTVTTANTAVPLASSFTQAKVVVIFNNSANQLWVGDSTAVVGNGVPIYPSQTVELGVTDLSKVYVNCGTASSAFSWNVFW